MYYGKMIAKVVIGLAVFLGFLLGTHKLIILIALTPQSQLAQVGGGLGQVISFWGPDIDAISGNEWPQYVQVFQDLKQLGFTHTGVHLWNYPPDSTLVANRISEIRAITPNITFHHSPGHFYLTEELDPNNHQASGNNLKYFDAPGFNPSVCPNCKNPPHPIAIDPGYAGELWQKELVRLQRVLNSFSLVAGDIVALNTEIWGTEWALNWYYPSQPIQTAATRYSGTAAERSAQFINYERQRGNDIKQIIRTIQPATGVLFYGENIPELHEFTLSGGSSYWPAGTGDAPSPSFYLLPNFSGLQNILALGNFSNSYVWISFSVTSRSEVWVKEKWDPLITQKAGYLLRQKGVRGVIEYPGPELDKQPAAEYLVQAKAFMDGFVRGLDPGTLTEKCADRMDNDGDGQIDESGCVKPVTTCATFTYSDWSGCQSNNTQTRAVTASSPTGCTGGNTVLSQSCTYAPLALTCVEDWSCGVWSACSLNQQARVCTDENACGTILEKPRLTKTCEVNPVPEVPPLPLVPLATAQFAPLTSLFAIGERGAHVTQLQAMLIADGSYVGSATGYYGPETVAAVKKFQIKYGIATTPETVGLSGPTTRAKLNQLYATPATTQSRTAMILALQIRLLDLLKQLLALLLSR